MEMISKKLGINVIIYILNSWYVVKFLNLVVQA